MDLSSFNTPDLAYLHVESPVDGTPLYLNDDEGKADRAKPVRILLRGKDSPEYRTAEHKIRNQRLKGVGRRGKIVSVTAEALEMEATELMATCVVNWENVVIGGESIPFSKEAATKLIEDFPWIREQVDEFISDRANFLGDA